jgi:threonine/homoserine/homoserine lactone efflux protein
MTNDLLPLATYCALMSSTPGPNNVMLTVSGANFGYRRTLPHILGIVLGGAVQTLLCCIGLGALMAALPSSQAFLRIAGALYLLWLAWRLAGSTVADSALQRPLSFLQGLSFQAVNPKAWTRAMTLGAVFMPPGLATLEGALLVSGIGTAISMPCISMWAVFGMAIRRFLASPRHRRLFNAMMAATLAVLALMFLR